MHLGDRRSGTPKGLASFAICGIQRHAHAISHCIPHPPRRLRRSTYDVEQCWRDQTLAVRSDASCCRNNSAARLGTSFRRTGKNVGGYAQIDDPG